jgi:hypothetical protein
MAMSPHMAGCAICGEPMDLQPFGGFFGIEKYYINTMPYNYERVRAIVGTAFEAQGH